MATQKPRLPLPLQCRPKLLKDYLNDNEQNSLVPKNIVLKRSKSKAATTTILAIHKASEMFIKTLKYLPFASIKYPSMLPRSISRRLSSRRRNYENNNQMEMVNANVKVKVKDILRWGSSRDLVNANMSMDDSKRNLQNDEDDEQYTPVSVLDTPFQVDDDSHYHLSLANLQRRKCALMEMIKEFESLSEVKPNNLEYDEFSTDDQQQQQQVNEADEEKAKKLLNCFRETNSSSQSYGHVEDNLLLDFFMHEHTKCRREKDENFDGELIKSAHDWLNGMYGEVFEWETEGNRISYVRDMENGVNWDKFEEEQEEMALQVEGLIFSSLVNELLIDLH